MSSWHGRRKKDNGYRGGPDLEMRRLEDRAYSGPSRRALRAMARRQGELPDPGGRFYSPPANQPAASSPARGHAGLSMVADSSWLTFLTLVGMAALIAWVRYG